MPHPTPSGMVFEIIKMAESGLPPVEIERRVRSVSRTTIYSILAHARKAGRTIPRFPPRKYKYNEAVAIIRLAVWDSEMMAALDKARTPRKLSRTELVRRLLQQACDDRMIDAILDDGIKSDG